MRIVLLSKVPRWYSFRADRVVQRLADDSHEVVAVVAERCATLASLREWMLKFGPRLFAEKSVQKLRRQLRWGRASQGEGVPASRLSAGGAIPPVHWVDSHNSAACVELVRQLRPDVLILRGCGILKRSILEIPRLGAINPHYAFLPAYRGVDVTEWAALHGDPMAVSVHQVTEQVDIGTVLASQRISAEPGDTVGRLRDKSAAAAVELLTAALAKLDSGAALPVPLMITAGRQYFAMHPRLRQLTELRLKRAC